MSSPSPRSAALAAALLTCLGLATAGAQDGLPPVPPAAPACGEPVPGAACGEVAAALAGAEHNLGVARALAGEAVAGAQASLATLPCDAPLYVWTSATDGPGSCMDSDTLDGLDSGQLLRSDLGGRIEGDLVVGGLLVNEGFALIHHGADLVLGTGDGRPVGAKPLQRALVHCCAEDALFVNFDGDFEGGTFLGGPRTVVQGFTLEHRGADLVLGTGDGRAQGAKPLQRALVHGGGDELILNYDGDFEGGAWIMGPGLRVDGHVLAHGQHLDGIGDVAEPVAGEGLAPGDVVVLDGFDPSGKLRVRRAAEAYDRGVVGVVSADPSLRLDGGPLDTPLAVAGIVAVKVAGTVAAGDLLASSAVPGHAMACLDDARCTHGATLGKALEPHAGPGPGLVRALVSLG